MLMEYKITDISYLDKFKYLSYSTFYVKGLFYKEYKLIGELLIDATNI